MSPPAPPPPAGDARRFFAAWCAAAALGATALALLAPYDLQISRAVADPRSPFGQLVSARGQDPGWALILGALALLALPRRAARWPRLAPLRPLARAVILLALLGPTLLTQTLKQLWGRVRFCNLAPDLHDYTPFTVPAGVGAGESFPSGHAAMAALGLLVPLYLLLRRRGALGQALAWLLAGAYALGVAWGRVRLGKHYACDVLFSLWVTPLLGALLLRWQLRRGEDAGPGPG